MSKENKNLVTRLCTCDCCYDVWYLDNMKNIKFGNRNRHIVLCPDCFKDFDKEFVKRSKE